MPTPDTFDDAIRAQIAELMEASPPAPLLGELDELAQRPVRTARRSWRPNVPRPWVLLGGMGAACLTALLLVLVLPNTGERIPIAEAAQLRLIAANAAGQPDQPLASDQWVMSHATLSYLATVDQVGSTPVVGAQATVGATLDQWSNRFGQTCSSLSAKSLSFATPANRATWLSLGLPESPSGEPIESCASYLGATISNGESFVIDVSALSLNPSTLAKQLETGTTGIGQVDGTGSAADPSSGLQRAAFLLVGPTVGSSPALVSSVYNALALMPGIQKLGQVTTHSGAVGLGFSSNSPEGVRTIVVNPSTGSVLEVQNIQSRSITMDLLNASAFVAPTSSVSTQGGSDGTKIQWIDIDTAQSIVDTDQLPSGLNPSPPPTAVITAVAKPGVPYGPLDLLQQQLNAQYGAPSGGYGYGAARGGAVLDFDFSGSTTQVNDFAQALRNSDLIASVKVNIGDN
jgi:hypothetical protein